MPSPDLPSFERPPVIETVMGVQFDPLPGLHNAHLGAFWTKLEPGKWPKVTDAPALEPQFERFDESLAWRGLKLKLTQDPSARIQIRNASGDRMIQVQNGRFHYNWLGHHGGPYPRYSVVRPEFDVSLELFKRFLKEVEAGELHPNQWETTYVNHIPKGSVWKVLSEWSNVVEFLGEVSASQGSVSLESLSGEWHFEIQPQRGRLHVQLKHVREGSAENGEILRLTLTARGPIASRGSEGLTLDEGLNLGRETIVRTFKEITSKSAHEHWGLCDAED